MKSRFNPVLIIVMLIGLIGAVWLNYTRYQIEEQNKTVEMAMEYEGLQHLADWEGLPFETVLKDFKDAGVTSLIVFDTTLQKLNDKGIVYATPGRELMQSGTASGRFSAVPQQLVADAVYITEGSSPVAFKEVEQDLHLRYADSRIAVVSESPRIIRVLGDPRIIEKDNYDTKQPLMQAPLGLSTEEMQTVANAGFNVIVRPQNYLPVTEAQIDSVFDRIDKSGANVVSYIGCGKEVVGFPDKLDYMAEKLLERDMVFGMVEHYTQLQFAPMEGLIPLAEKMDYQVARSYIIGQDEQRKLKIPEALRRWALTDEERNIRINYIKPFMLPQNGQDILELNLDYVSSIAGDVQARGFKLGTSDVFANPDGSNTGYFPDKKLLILPALAVVAACLMYISLTFGFLPFKWQNIIMASSGLCVACLLLKAQPPLLRQALAFASACVFPVLSMIVIVEWWDSVKVRCKCLVQFIMRTTVQLGLAVLMSLCGAAMISALLGDVRFFLEIDIYRGVKLTFIMPVLLMLLWYVKRFNVFGGKTGGGIIDDIRYLLSTHIRLEHLFILGVLAFVAYIFVGRSGHTSGVPVLGIELKMRAMLEQLMYARPRTKEFMIGHPAFFVAAYAAYYKAPRLWQMILVAGAVIGQGSLVQTFAHMRTPVIMSYIRALDGYWLGALIGICAVIVLNLLMPYLQKWQRRYLGNE